MKFINKFGQTSYLFVCIEPSASSQSKSSPHTSFLLNYFNLNKFCVCVRNILQIFVHTHTHTSTKINPFVGFVQTKCFSESISSHYLHCRGNIYIHTHTNSMQFNANIYTRITPCQFRVNCFFTYTGFFIYVFASLMT